LTGGLAGSRGAHAGALVGPRHHGGVDGLAELTEQVLGCERLDCVPPAGHLAEAADDAHANAERTLAAELDSQESERLVT
jgi:hypothetical protein